MAEVVHPLEKPRLIGYKHISLEGGKTEVRDIYLLGTDVEERPVFEERVVAEVVPDKPSPRVWRSAWGEGGMYGL